MSSPYIITCVGPDFSAKTESRMNSKEEEYCPAQAAVTCTNADSSNDSRLATDITTSEDHIQCLLKEFKEQYPFIESCWIANDQQKRKCIVVANNWKREYIAENSCSLPTTYEELQVNVCEDANNFQPLAHFRKDGFPKYTIPVEKMTQLQNVLINKAPSLMERHSNLRAICGSPFKYFDRKGRFEVLVCIALYCRGKGYIPLGEAEFPHEIGGIRTDVREGYFKQGMTNRDLPQSKDRHENLRIGAKIIGIQSSMSGTLGGFIPLPQGGIGFLTCAHVVYKIRELIQKNQHQWYMLPKAGVGQPDQNPFNKVGNVYSHAFCFGTRTAISIDAACIEITDVNRLPSDGFMTKQKNINLRMTGFEENNPPCFVKGRVVDHCEDKNFGRMVIKCGAESGLTPGMLEVDATILRLENPEMCSPDPARRIIFYQQYIVRSMNDVTFFQQGDSGSLVFIQDGGDLKCFGMAIGELTDGGCIVTPIHAVLESLNLSSFLSFHSPNEQSSSECSDVDNDSDNDDGNDEDGKGPRDLFRRRRNVSGENATGQQKRKVLRATTGKSRQTSKKDNDHEIDETLKQNIEMIFDTYGIFPQRLAEVESRFHPIIAATAASNIAELPSSGEAFLGTELKWNAQNDELSFKHNSGQTLLIKTKGLSVEMHNQIPILSSRETEENKAGAFAPETVSNDINRYVKSIRDLDKEFSKILVADVQIFQELDLNEISRNRTFLDQAMKSKLKEIVDSKKKECSVLCQMFIELIGGMQDHLKNDKPPAEIETLISSAKRKMEFLTEVMKASSDNAVRTLLKDSAQSKPV